MKTLYFPTRISPCDSNRRAMVEHIRTYFRTVGAAESSRLASKIRSELVALLDGPSAPALRVGIRSHVASSFILRESVELAIASNQSSVGEDIWESLEVSLSSVNIFRHQLGSELSGYQHNAVDAAGYLKAWGFLLRVDPSRARWLGAHLYNWYRAGSMDRDIQDPIFRDFMWLLVKSYVERTWQNAVADDVIGPYADLYSACRSGVISEIDEAVFGICDYRLARSWGYEYFSENSDLIDIDNSTDSSFFASEMSGGWMAAFPLELYIFQSVYQDVTGNEFILSRRHPLIEIGMMDILAADKNWRSSRLARAIDLYGERTFGKSWAPFSPVRLLDG